MEKLNTAKQLANDVFDYEYKPKFSTVKVVVTDSDEVYAINGSDCYKINFAEDLIWVIKNTKGNQGWWVVDKQTNETHLKQVIEILIEKDYIGVENVESLEIYQ